MSKIKILAIDIGHNVKYDTGAVGIRKEDDLNSEVGIALINKFKAIGIKVVNCTPKSAVSLSNSLSQRCKAANEAHADFLVSIHHNACPGGYGAEVLCYSKGLGEEVGKSVLSEISKLGFRNRGIKYRNDLYILNNTVMESIIVECAFCDSKMDMTNYNSERMAEAIFKGICKVLNISTSTSDNSIQKYYTVKRGDTLWSISRMYGVTVDSLVKKNGISNRNMIYVGQKIKI